MLFESGHRDKSIRLRRHFAAYEIAYTFVDFLAAILFVIGSIMFFSESWVYTGTWLFLIGSVCFALKPTIRLVRELRLTAIGDEEVAAAKFKE